MNSFKKIIACASAIVTMAASASVTTSAAASYHFRGDVNNNGLVNAEDGRALQDFLLGRQTRGLTRASSDLNGDGVVNIYDMVVMRRILAGTKKKTLYVQGDNKEFHPGQIFLDNGTYYGIVQGDGNVVVYRRSDGHPVFNTETCYHDDYKNYRLVFQAEDGNIVLYATPNYPGARERAIWNSQTCSKNKFRPYMLEFDAYGNLVWNSESGAWWRSTAKRRTNPMTTAERTALAKYRLPLNYDYCDHYDTYEQAAIDFIFYYNPTSVAENTEYGTTILKCSNGRYRLDLTPPYGIKGPRRGDNQTDGEGPSLAIYAGESVAYVHTHGRLISNLNEYFSIRLYGNETGQTDISIARGDNSANQWMVAYLGTPTGNIRRYDPFKDPYPTTESNAGKVIMTGVPH